jgi:hypothetical protein
VVTRYVSSAEIIRIEIREKGERKSSHLDDMQGLVHRSLSIKGETGIDFGGNFARNDCKNLLTELNQQTVKTCVDFLFNGFAL